VGKNKRKYFGRAAALMHYGKIGTWEQFYKLNLTK
jgi:hypothetical protein